MRLSPWAIAATTVLATVASAHRERRHAHEAIHLKRSGAEGASVSAGGGATCSCTTYVTTVTGEAVLIEPTHSTSTSHAIVVPIPAEETETSTQAAVPTPVVTVYPLPGTYTIPAQTVTLTSPTTVPAAVSTGISSGTYTFGGVTTVVETATTITCPYASVETSGSVVKSKIYTTTYVCPSAGTYTIAPLTTTVTESTLWVLPVPTSYMPGTYTQPATTVTVTLTSQFVFCPFSTVEPTPATTHEAPPPPSSPPVEEKTYAAPPPPEETTAVETTAYEAPAPPSTEAAPSSSSSPSAEAAPSASSGGGHIGGGEQWCMTYSPYTSAGQCKSQGEVDQDISDIAKKGFVSVRVYGTDCDGLPNIGAAVRKYGLKMVTGVFIDNKGVAGAQKQVDDLVAWKQWDLVELMVIGNEALFNGHCTASELASFIGQAKEKFRASGYSGPCTTTESSVTIIKDNADVLCPVLDILAVNVHPFFNAAVSADMAGDFVRNELKNLADVCPGDKEVLNLETGWPSQGEANGLAVPGEEEQRKAIAAIKAAVGGKVAFFSYT